MSDFKAFNASEWKEQGLIALKVFNEFQKEHPNLIFYMSRSCDTKLYGYFANRTNNTLMPSSEVACQSIICPDWRTKSHVPDLVLNSFFALQVLPIPNTKKYSATLAGFPERVMTLNLKQDSKPNKNDGIVTSTSVMHVAGIALQDVRIFCMHKIMTFGPLDVPDVQRIVVFGSVPKKDVPPALAAKLHPSSDTQFLVWEEFPVTEDVLKRFDIGAMTKAYLFSTK